MRRQCRLAPPRQRTFADIAGAPPLARLLEVLLEPRTPIFCAPEHPASLLCHRTEFERPAYGQIRNKGMLAVFEAAHLPTWTSRSLHHQSHSKMLMPTLSNHILSRESKGQRQKLPFPHSRCGTPTGRPTGLTTPSPSGLVRQRQTTLFRDQRHVVLSAHGISTRLSGEKWGMENSLFSLTENHLPPPIEMRWH